MATARKRARKRLEGRVAEVERHLARIAETPEHSSVSKWRSEVRNWLREMEEALPDVGKKTAEEWQQRLDDYRRALGE